MYRPAAGTRPGYMQTEGRVNQGPDAEVERGMGAILFAGAAHDGRPCRRADGVPAGAAAWRGREPPSGRIPAEPVASNNFKEMTTWQTPPPAAT